MFSIDKKQFYAFIIPLLLMVGMLITVFVVVNNIKQDEKRISDSSIQSDNLDDEVIDTNCPADKSYCVYSHHDQKYLITNNEYSKEHDIIYFTVSKSDTNSIKAFSNYTYDEYKDFCEEYKLDQKYTDKNKRYIVYFFNSKLTAPTTDIRVHNSLYTRLSDVKFKDSKVVLYIWDKVTDLGGVYAISPDELRTKAYAIVIPTEEATQEYVVRPLIHHTDYNRIAGLNPMAGYNYSITDNKDLATNIKMVSKNAQFNTIVEKSIRALANEHTVKVATTRTEFPTPILYSYLDLISSVYKVQTATEANHYTAYTNDMALHYSLYGSSQNASSTSAITDRNAVLKDVLREFSDIDIFDDAAEYSVNVTQDINNFIVKLTQYKSTASSATKSATTIYFNKRSYLPSRIINSTGTHDFTYTKDTITLPDDIDRNASAAMIN